MLQGIKVKTRSSFYLHFVVSTQCTSVMHTNRQMDRQISVLHIDISRFAWCRAVKIQGTELTLV